MVETERSFTLSADADLRADKFFAEITGCSRTRIQKNIELENILLNGRPLLKNSFNRFKKGDVVELEFAPLEELSLKPENIPLDIVFENEEFLVVDKPAGMVVHPAPGHYTGTLMNAVAYHLGVEPSSDIRPGLPHRIDKDTSGLIVIAKTPDTLDALIAQFAVHSIKRRYIALVWGHLKGHGGTVDTGHRRDPKNRERFIPGEGGRRAVTHWVVAEEYKHISRLELHLETGRTHQIRMHMRHLGHPVVNDALYGGIMKSGRGALDSILKRTVRQMLHAAELGFTLNGKNYMFTAPIPADMAEVMAAAAE